MCEGGNTRKYLKFEQKVVSWPFNRFCVIGRSHSGYRCSNQYDGPPLDMSRKLTGTPVADGYQQIMQIMERLGEKRLIVPDRLLINIFVSSWQTGTQRD
jgi:hypothetical protein